MNVAHDSYETFLAEDPRRGGDALELGLSRCGEDLQWRVCWYEATGELTVEGIDHSEIDADDFHAGVSGPVHVLATVPSRHQLEQLVGRWPTLEYWRPQTLGRLRALLTR